MSTAKKKPTNGEHISARVTTGQTPEQPTEHALTIYKALEARIEKSDLDSLLARWEFGRRLLERGDNAKLPTGTWKNCVMYYTIAARRR